MRVSASPSGRNSLEPLPQENSDGALPWMETSLPQNTPSAPSPTVGVTGWNAQRVIFALLTPSDGAKGRGRSPLLSLSLSPCP